MCSFNAAIILALYSLLACLLTPAQVDQTIAPADTELRRIQNIAPGGDVEPGYGVFFS
jgi:hypothetical protein